VLADRVVVWLKRSPGREFRRASRAGRITARRAAAGHAADQGDSPRASRAEDVGGCGVASIGELARRLGQDRGHVGLTLDLAFLSPALRARIFPVSSLPFAARRKNMPPVRGTFGLRCGGRKSPGIGPVRRGFRHELCSCYAMKPGAGFPRGSPTNIVTAQQAACGRVFADLSATAVEEAGRDGAESLGATPAERTAGEGEDTVRGQVPVAVVGELLGMASRCSVSRRRIRLSLYSHRTVQSQSKFLVHPLD